MTPMTIEYTPKAKRVVEDPEMFKALDTERKFGLVVYDGRAELVGWSNVRAQHDRMGYFHGGYRMTIEQLCAFVDAYRQHNRAGVPHEQ
jgi:hypothetical protein